MPPYNFLMNNIRAQSQKQERIHLDYAATTPVLPEIFESMTPYFCNMWANASALYAEGVSAREVIEEERVSLARILRVRPTDIVYTSGGTESNNLAIRGYIATLHEQGVPYSDMEIISTYIEHPSITEVLRHLEAQGVHIIYAPIHEEGRIDIPELEKLFSQRTRLITYAYVNAEIGVVQDVKKISRVVRHYNEQQGGNIRTHLDACQAGLWLPCALDALGVDMLTLDAGKCYGPKGVGVLVKRHTVTLTPIIFGGGQEQGLRSGTENVALVVGCTRALVRAQRDWEARSARVQPIRDYAISRIREKLPHAILNGSVEFRVANNINFSLPGIDGEYAVITLDAKGVAAATRSACGTKNKSGSHVVRALSGDDARALSTIRLTLGESSTSHDIDVALSIIEEHVTLMS